MQDMRVQPFNFKELSDGAPPGTGPAAKAFLKVGRSREVVPPPPLPPVFSEEDMKTAEREGYKKGFLDGVQEGRKQAASEQAGIDRGLTQTVERFAQAVSPLLAYYRRMSLELQQESPKVALAI